MAFSSVRGTRAARKHTYSLHSRRYLLSCSAERHQPPLLKPTSSDPKKQESAPWSSEASARESVASLLAKELLDDGVASSPLQNEDVADEALFAVDGEGPFGESRDSSGKVLVVKKPTLQSGPRRLTRDGDKDKASMAKAMTKKTKNLKPEPRSEKSIKSKMLVSTRPRKQSSGQNVHPTTASDVVDTDCTEAARKAAEIEPKRDGNVLVVKRSPMDPSADASDTRLNRNKEGMEGRKSQTEAVEKLAVAKRSSKDDAHDPDRPYVIKRPRPPSLKSEPKSRQPSTDRTSKPNPNVIVAKRSTSQSSASDQRIKNLSDLVRDLSDDVQESKDAIDAPKVIERPRPRPVELTPVEYRPPEDLLMQSESREPVLIVKQDMQKVMSLSNKQGTFVESEEPASKQTASTEVRSEVGGSSDGPNPQGQGMVNPSDAVRQLQGGSEDIDVSSATTRPFDDADSSMTQNKIPGTESRGSAAEPPSLSAPPSRWGNAPLMTGDDASDEPRLPEEEEGLRIRRTLLDEIQRKRRDENEIRTSAKSNADPSFLDRTASSIKQEPIAQSVEAAEEERVTGSVVDEDTPVPESLPTKAKEKIVTVAIGDGMESVSAEIDAPTPPVDLSEESEAVSSSSEIEPESRPSKTETASVGDSSTKTENEDRSEAPLDASDDIPAGLEMPPPKFKLQGPPKKLEAPPRKPTSPLSRDVRSLRGAPKNVSEQLRPTASLTNPMPPPRSPEAKPKPLNINRLSSPKPRPPDTENKQNLMQQPKERPAVVARPPTKPSPVLVRKPSKGEHSKPVNIELDRLIMKEKEKIKREEVREEIEKQRAQRLEWRQQKEKESRTKKLKRSDSSLIENRRKARLERQQRRYDAQEDAEGETIIEVGAEGLSVEELGSLLAMDPAEVMKVLFVKGVMVTVNQTLDVDSVKVVAAEVGVDVVDKDEISPTEMATKGDAFVEEDDQNAVERPPVVTVMGHVDHGKTTLLDYIRQTRVALGEAGGITQAIGAYTCSVDIEGNERTICFLDTPGHEAFSAMRARGTRVTDVAVIIVAADDGMRPQTKEAIDHAKAAAVPIVVAINKIDAPGADPERVKRELSEMEMLPEEWGGQTPVVQISAKTGEGVDALLEMLTLVSDIQLDLRANADVPAKGTVIEAYMDKRSGAMATVLVQNGTLNVGDAIVAGAAFGKVRSMTDAVGNQVSSAGPSIAVQLMGFHDLPSAGDIFTVGEDEAQAKAEAEQAAIELRRKHLIESAGGGSMVTLSSLASVDEEDNVDLLQRLNLVFKADTVGSLEAAKGALAKLPQDSVMIRYLHASAGEVTESDVLLAAAAEGVVVSFNASIGEAVKAVAKQQNVELRSYAVIYDLIDDVRGIMEGELRPAEDRLAIGKAEVRAVFGSGSQRVAGCMVTEGRLEKGCFVRISRKKAVRYEGTLNSLRRVKEKVETVETGLECGVGCEGYSDWEEGDRIEAYTIVQKRATLEEAHATTAVDQEALQQMAGSSDT